MAVNLLEYIFIWYISHKEQNSVSFPAKQATTHHFGNSV